MASQNFILPPPVGIGNDLYEAFPQFDMGTAPFGKSSGAARPDTTITSGNDTFKIDPVKAATGAAIFAATGDPIPALNAVSAGGQPSPQQNSSGGLISQGAVIVLGFIFVAAGLFMFRSPIVVQSPVR